jgi:hypothetical protein
VPADALREAEESAGGVEEDGGDHGAEPGGRRIIGIS